MPGVNRRQAKELFRAKQVRLNGKASTGAERVVTGDLFSIPDSDAAKTFSVKTAPRLTTPHGRHLIRLYEDESILVISKPTEIPVHKGQGGFLRRDTLEDVLARAYPPPPNAAPSQQGFYFVHRLDMETSGCLLIAKSEAVRDAMILDFSQRKIHKEYLAITAGAVEWDSLTVKKSIAYIKADDLEPAGRPNWKQQRRKPILRGVKKGIPLEEGDPAGKSSETQFKVMTRFNGYTLIHAMPKTGRTHQIRVHLESTGHPLAYDPLYGRHSPIRLREFYPRFATAEEGEEIVLNRLPLHAWKLGFTHPVSHAAMKFEAPIPRDLKDFIRILKKYRGQP